MEIGHSFINSAKILTNLVSHALF